MTASPPSAATLRRIDQATGALATTAAQRMTDELGWFATLPAEERSWVGLVAQAGIRAFVDSLSQQVTGEQITAAVFGAAPSELVRVVSLSQTVELVRLVVDVVEQGIPTLADGAEAGVLREATLRFSREVAFAAAGVYARAAEQRGAWHARQQALLVDALIRGEAAESIRGRALGLGWTPPAELAVLVGLAPAGPREAVIDECERRARHLGLDALAGLHDDWLVVVAGATGELAEKLLAVSVLFDKGAVVRSNVLAEIGDAPAATQEALAGARVASAWPTAPPVVAAAELLPERALGGDPLARAALQAIHDDLRLAGADVLATVHGYLANGASVEATARAMFLHPNTVRYRLRKATAASGIPVMEPRGAFTLQCALVQGLLAQA